MNTGLLIAQAGHGPGIHAGGVGLVLLVAVGIALVAGLGYVLRRRRRSGRGPDDPPDRRA